MTKYYNCNDLSICVLNIQEFNGDGKYECWERNWKSSHSDAVNADSNSTADADSGSNSTAGGEYHVATNIGRNVRTGRRQPKS